MRRIRYQIQVGPSSVVCLNGSLILQAMFLPSMSRLPSKRPGSAWNRNYQTHSQKALVHTKHCANSGPTRRCKKQYDLAFFKLSTWFSQITNLPCHCVGSEVLAVARNEPRKSCRQRICRSHHRQSLRRRLAEGLRRFQAAVIYRMACAKLFATCASKLRACLEARILRCLMKNW